MIKPNFTYLAIASFCDNIPSSFHFKGDTAYENLQWETSAFPKPSAEAVAQKAQQLETEWEAAEYQRQRALEYPPVTDYIDGVVKGDQAQIDAYIAACQAVKNKYPKPE
jgi:hypothetical protein